MAKTGNERFILNGKPKDFILKDFWSWFASDLLDNTLRGTLAEFIVSNALGVTVPKENWNAYDIKFDKWKIEVKSSAFLQSWSQKRASTITFSIRPTRAWTRKDGRAIQAKRQSDMYIFCVLSETDKEKVNPLNLDQWDFYPVLTSVFDQKHKTQKTIGLASLKKLCPDKCNYDSLYEAVVGILA